MGASRLYVGGLPHGANERDLERFFRGYGRLRDVLLKNGYGFVEFEDYRDAEDAIYELNGKKMLGCRITVEKARGTPRGREYGRDGYAGRDNHRGGGGGGDRDRDRDRGGDRYGPPTRTKYRVVVENLSSRVSWQDLKDYMRQAGEVTFADAHKRHRNEGIVEFQSQSDMKNAIDKLDNTELNGRTIKVMEDKPRRSRSYSDSSRSRSKSRSRSRHRSRSRSRSRSRGAGGADRGNARGGSGDRKSRSRSRSHSRKKSVSRSPHNDRGRGGGDKASRSRSKSRSYSKERGGTRSKSRSRSRSTGR